MLITLFYLLFEYDFLWQVLYSFCNKSLTKNGPFTKKKKKMCFNLYDCVAVFFALTTCSVVKFVAFTVVL